MASDNEYLMWDITPFRSDCGENMRNMAVISQEIAAIS
jgi:hypothetical protein